MCIIWYFGIIFSLQKLSFKPVSKNRFETETGFNKKTVLGLVFLEKLLI